MHLIFDFDGTLIDSYQKVIEKFNYLAEQFDFRKIDEQELEKLRELNSKQLIKNLHIPFYKLPKIIHHARKEMRKEILNLLPFPNMPEVLEKLFDNKFILGVLTSNSEVNVATWLKYHKIHHLFHFIHSEPNYFSKKRVLKKMIKTYGMDKTKAFYIGDETRDIEAAKKAGIYSIAVTWGFNSEKILLAQEPHYIARTPEDIIKIFTAMDFR